MTHFLSFDDISLENLVIVDNISSNGSVVQGYSTNSTVQTRQQCAHTVRHHWEILEIGLSDKILYYGIIWCPSDKVTLFNGA